MISKEMQAKKDWCFQCNGTGFIAEFHGEGSEECIVEHPCPKCNQSERALGDALGDWI